MSIKAIFKKMIVIMLTAAITAGAFLYIAPSADAGTVYAASTKKKEKKAYNKIMAQQSKYPEGMAWNDSNKYKGRTACQAFAFLMSDIAYGKNAKYYSHYDFGVLKVGDIIITTQGGTHAVVVLNCDVSNDKITVCEGNYGGTVHWGREIAISELARSGHCVISRIPYKENHKASLKKPKKVKKVTYKVSGGDSYFYPSPAVSCTTYQYIISTDKAFPYMNSQVAYPKEGENFVYAQGTISGWGTAYIKVRAVKISGGKVSYGKWSKVYKIN
ncbi:hypothetical protein [Butyrivibrio sp. INlla16]|uniref:hypothetical protein n=1 Tax=Butyrivibrio sp. INlla16 TaxID=1520807 RepID=UPI00088D928F|nr:hypothetical protein [Butyrivibrio sp. INlla16]SDB10387.1 hypothetical protein SAMN02910263_00479 [Butyrivibrio sp. INlla16]